MLTMRYVVLRADDGQVYYARPTHDEARFIRPRVVQSPAPPLAKNQNLETSGIHSATLAACLALGIPVKRGILLANCAGESWIHSRFSWSGLIAGRKLVGRSLE